MSSVKTEALVDLFPDAYGASEPDALLRQVLDAVGAELMVADGAVKRLLKSHWVDYAEGAALDGLGGTFGVERRRLRGGGLEGDDAFRRRLKSIVPLFTGGGTRRAVKGAVQSALGLPFDLATLNVPAALRDELDALVALEEFSPTAERRVFENVAGDGDVTELVVDIDVGAAADALPRIAWTFPGGGRELSVERLDVGAGVRSEPAFALAPGSTLVLSTLANGTFSAVIDRRDVSAAFTDIAGTGPPSLPPVPVTASQWRLRARGATFDFSRFDGDESFDAPRFTVELAWVRTEPLTFDVTVPYFLQETAAAIVRRHGYAGDVFVFEGLPLDAIQRVVDETKAAGVRGNVHFALRLTEDQRPREGRMKIDALHRRREDAGGRDAMTIGSVSAVTERHGSSEAFALAAEFDVATFDGPFGFV